MSAEKYINEDCQEVTILRNGTKEFDEYWSKHYHPFDYSSIIPGEKCPFDKDLFAKELELTRNKDCKECENLLSFFYNNYACKGPITSYFYTNKFCPESYPVYFEVDVLDGYINNPKYKFYNKEYGGRISIKDDFIACKNLLSNPIDFGLAYSNDMTKRAIVTFGHQLIALDKQDQHRWIKHILVQNEYGANSSFVDFVLGRSNNRFSIFRAVLEEISVINLICDENEIPRMFLKEFIDKYEYLSGYNVNFSQQNLILCALLPQYQKYCASNLTIHCLNIKLTYFNQ